MKLGKMLRFKAHYRRCCCVLCCQEPDARERRRQKRRERQGWKRGLSDEVPMFPEPRMDYRLRGDGSER